MPINAADVRCPKCQGPVWDERPDKKNPRGPDFRCKDKTCLDEKGYKTSIWEKDLLKATPARAAAPVPAAPTNARQPYSSGPPIAGLDDGSAALPTEKLDAIFRVYDVCFQHAFSLAERTMKQDASHEGISAMAATCFIAATKAGV